MGFEATKLLKVLRDAAIHLRAAKSRRGTVAWLDDAQDVLISGDLHGHLDNLRKIVAIADLDAHPDRHLVLQEFVHGSERYPNGGCMSHQVLDSVACLKCKYPHRVHLLMGNHEMSQWSGRSIAKDGYSLNDLFELGVEQAYGPYAEEVMKGYHSLIASMLLAVRTPNGVFITHSVPDNRALRSFDVGVFALPKLELEHTQRGTSAHQLLWGRDTTEETTRQFAEMVGARLLITGHIAHKTGYGAPNRQRLILDCMGRPAACLLLQARQAVTFDDLLSGIILLPEE